MDFSFLKMPEELIRAICTTLLHSLWQGLLLSIFAGLIIIFTRRSSAAYRYNLLVGGLAIFCASIIFTLFYQLAKEKEVTETIVTSQQIEVNSNIEAISLSDNQLSSGQLMGFLTNHSNTIVLIWFLIVLARTIQLLTGINSLYELRKNATFNVGADLKHNLIVLLAKMGIKQTVEVAESAMIKVPMVIGHLKPLILIPIGLLTALSPSAVEAILIHELAHISRRDYLVNLMISLLEVILFFNPAVLWIASLIRAEREHCCDDIVVAQTSSKTDYIKALITCQEYHLAAPTFAIPLQGNKKHLLGRVKRMLSKDNQSLNSVEKSLLSICLLIAGLFTVAFSNVDKLNRLVNKASDHVMQVSKEIRSNMERKESIATTASPSPNPPFTENNIYTAVPDTAKCEIYLPGEVSDHTSSLITNGDYQTRLLKQNGILYQINFKEGKVGSLQVNGQTVPVNEHKAYVAIIDSIQQSKRPLPKLAPLKTRLAYVPHQLNYRADSLKRYGPAQMKYGTPKIGYETQLPPASPVSPIAKPAPVSLKISNGTDVSRQLAEAILNDGLVSNLKSFKLTESELIVNGKRISDEAFRSFKSKNIDSIQKGTIVYYNFDTSTTTKLTYI